MQAKDNGIRERAEAYNLAHGFTGICSEVMIEFAASEVERAKCTLNHFPISPVVPNSAEHWFHECELKNAEVDKLAEQLAALQAERDNLATAVKVKEDFIVELRKDLNGRVTNLQAELAKLRKVVEAARKLKPLKPHYAELWEGVPQAALRELERALAEVGK